MSGGVDSAVSALLLREQGYEVQGLFMANWEEDEEGYCTTAGDFQAARTACEELGIPLHKVSFAAEYRDRVFAHFLAEYAAGRTPNPDVLCNREVKFGVCLQHARRLGADVFATGHYARLAEQPAAPPWLLRGADATKDQSYFLHQVPAAMLADTLFPVGHLQKQQVRALARQAGLPVHDRPDSTGICFIGERPFREFLARYLPANPGPIETQSGEEIGRHHGLMYYTLGQRGGLGIGGRAGSSEAAWFVARKDVRRNALLVVQGHDHELLQSQQFNTGPVHWIGAAPALPLRCTVKVRYRQTDRAALVTPLVSGGPQALQVTLAEPERAITPGQYAVFYADERCLGGAVIEQVAQAAPGRQADTIAAVGANAN
jgi:tRNA-specific 2-thiouridylase